MKRYFRLKTAVKVVTVYQEDDSNQFEVRATKLGEITDYRDDADFLIGWVRIGVGPNDEMFVSMARLERAAQWLSEDDYHDAVAANQIFETTWLDTGDQQFELTKVLGVHQWIPNSDAPDLPHLRPIVLPAGTIGKIIELSWDFEGSNDKQYWMMEIKIVDGRHCDVIYPELLAASKPVHS